MSWLRKWFAVRPQTRQAPRPRIVPRLEVLEGRWVPTVTFHGGVTLPNVQVQALYYGDQWYNNSALYQETGKFDGYLQYLVNSPYMDMLTKAGYGVGRGSWTQGTILEASLNSNYYLEDSTIQNAIQTDIYNGFLQVPTSDRLYVVYVEPNIAVQMSNGATSQNTFAGYHGSFEMSNGWVAHYAVVTTPGGTVGNGSANNSLNTFDEMTMVSSHEIAEAVTDTNINFSTPIGWYDDQRNEEIGDIVAGQTVYLNGYAVQKIADQNDNAMVPSELSVSGLNFSASAGRIFSGAVAVGDDPTGLTQDSDLEATIYWGDGTSSIGSIQAQIHGFVVDGTHTYGASGNYSVHVSLQDVTNSIGYASETMSESVQVAPEPFEVDVVPGQGVLRHSSSGWQQLTSLFASDVAVDAHGDVVAELPGYGVWRYEDATGWKRLTPIDASQVSIAGDGIVAAELPGYGVWRFEDSTSWRRLTPIDASQLAIADNGIVAVELPGYGVWRFEDAAGWQRLTIFNASQVAVDANGDVAADIAGNGVLRYENAGGWQQLLAADASRISMAGNGIVAVTVPGGGVRRFEDATGWEQLSTDPASQVAVDANGDVAADLNGVGVWLFQDGLSWGQLTSANAQDIGLGD